MEAQCIRRHHRHQIKHDQCTSAFVKHIKAPIHLVWSLVWRFDKPQKYEPFISSCIMQGDIGIGSVREANIKSGLSATTSTERLELFDDDEHILAIKIVGSDHRLRMSTFKYFQNLPYDIQIYNLPEDLELSRLLTVLVNETLTPSICVPPSTVRKL